jgi:hypothetical protein
LKDGTSRQKQTELINKLMRREGGRLVADPNSGYFQDLRQRSERRWRDEREKGAGVAHHFLVSQGNL